MRSKSGCAEERTVGAIRARCRGGHGDEVAALLAGEALLVVEAASGMFWCASRYSAFMPPKSLRQAPSGQLQPRPYPPFCRVVRRPP
jgi:hypothetical protein